MLESGVINLFVKKSQEITYLHIFSWIIIYCFCFSLPLLFHSKNAKIADDDLRHLCSLEKIDTIPVEKNLGWLLRS